MAIAKVKVNPDTALPLRPMDVNMIPLLEKNLKKTN